MDYEKIGMRVRFFRRRKGLSQEQLAELVDISVPHMSHIETGNTKLSLPVLAALARALDVRTDDLLYAAAAGDKPTQVDEIAALLEDCTPQQTAILAEILRAAKTALQKQM